MKFKLFLIFIFFLSVNKQSLAADLSLFRLGMEQGLSQYSVMNIYQDDQGAMWFGTREGANRYNGYSFEVYKPVLNDSNSIAGSIVNTICGDSKGHLYFSTEGGVSEFTLSDRSFKTITKTSLDPIYYSNNTLWLAQGNTLYQYNNKKLRPYFTLSDSKHVISKIFQASDKTIYIGTFSSGLYSLDLNKKLKQLLPPCSQILTIYEDRRKCIWIGTWQDGLIKITTDGEILHYNEKSKDQYKISSDFVRSICEDNFGNIWIGTINGLDKISVYTNQITHYGASNENSPYSLSNESVWSLYKDKQGSIWVGTYFGGANCFNPEINFYEYHSLMTQGKVLNPFPVISQIIEYDDHNFFLCTEGKGLYTYDIKTKQIKPIQYHAEKSEYNIKTAYYDQLNRYLYVGTHLGGLFGVDMKTMRFQKYGRSDAQLKQNEIVKCIIPYAGNLLVGTVNGLLYLNKKNGELSSFSEKINQLMPRVDAIAIDRDSNLWVAGRGAVKYNLKSGKLSYYQYEIANHTSLSNNNVVKIALDSKGNVCFATIGGGVNKYNKDKDCFIRYTSSTCGLMNDYVSNIAESKSGHLLITNTKGLSILDVDKNKVHNYSAENGFPLLSLLSGGLCVDHTGKAYVSGDNGMISFYEDKLNVSRKKCDITLDDLWVNNKKVIPGDDTKILKTALSYTTEIDLQSKHSIVSLSFLSSNYLKANQLKIEYQLIGYNDQKIRLSHTTNLLHFMNLPAGEYVLNVRGVSEQNGEILGKTNLKIHVHPPFYKTGWAYALYMILIISLTVLLIKIIRKISFMNASILFEKREKQQLEEINQSKLRFFTNISHEFRTPLTLIAGQLELLTQMGNIHTSVFSRIINIKKHVLMMQGLISELMEFRKSEQGLLHLKVSKHEIRNFIYEIYISFQEYARSRNISFDFVDDDNLYYVWIDPKQMQKVFYNLISNAFKYTPDGGAIVIKIAHSETDIIISIHDTGIGIPADSIDKIFDQFYQAENGLAINNVYLGSGIGLAFTKGIVDAHCGKIKVKSTPQIGSTFEVFIKQDKNHFAAELIVNEHLNDELLFDKEEGLSFVKQIIEDKVVENKYYTMLIVEDNEDLLIMLKEVFEPLYSVITARDGKEGLEKTIELQPDIIVSDVMMPRMSGVEMCANIKSNFDICHIPVLLLTAFTSLDHTLEGYNNGADDYFPKPFNIKMLIARCNNLINARKLLQEKFTKQIDFAPRMVATNRLDCEFIERASAIVEANISNSEFDVNVLMREMAMGRTTLFTKFKGITGQTPNDFILTVRLKKAAYLLQNNSEYSITDIACLLGFNTSKYFSKCFKEHYGVSPLNYKNVNKQSN